jgi:hypothetical protein
MTIPNLIHKLACAIAAQEGFFESGSIAQRQNNPGNLRGAPWSGPIVPKQEGYWSPTSLAQGQAGMLHLIAQHVAEGHTLTQLINAWAPAADGNEPETYIKNVAEWTGIDDPDSQLWNYLEPIEDPRRVVS